MKKNGLVAATLISIFLAVGNTAYAAVIGFEGVAPAGVTVGVGQNYAESGYNIFNPGLPGDAAVISSTSPLINNTGTDYYTWNSPQSNNPVVLTNLGGSNFNLNSIDVGTLSGTGVLTTFDITGFLFGGGTLVSNVVGAGAFTNLALGWTNLTKVEFQYITGFFSAIDNIDVSAVPLPAALPLFLSGLAGLGFIARRRKKQAA